MPLISDENGKKILGDNHRPQLEEDVMDELDRTSAGAKGFWVKIISFADELRRASMKYDTNYMEQQDSHRLDRGTRRYRYMHLHER